MEADGLSGREECGVAAGHQRGPSIEGYLSQVTLKRHRSEGRKAFGLFPACDAAT